LGARQVEDHQRRLVQRELGHGLLHEREALTAGPGRRPETRSGGTQRHVDALDLALRVDAHAPMLGQFAGHLLEELSERRHWVAGEEPAAGGDRGLRDRPGALE